MDVGTAVRIAFYNKISSLTYNSLPVAVFDEFQIVSQSSPYVVLSNQTENQIPFDDAFLWQCSIVVKVVAWGDFVIGKKAAEDLGDLIRQNVLSLRSELLNTVANFDITGVQLESTNTMPFPTNERVYITKLYRYGMQVQQ